MRRKWSLLLAAGAAMLACADGSARREIAAPDEDPVVALTRPDGDRIFPLLVGGARTEFISAPAVRWSAVKRRVAVAPSSAKAGSSARGNGDADLTYLSSRQRYTFTAQTSGLVPAALGTIQVSIVHATYHMEIDAAVDCVVASGNDVWVSGPVQRFVFNDVERPATIHLVFKVQDNGEGASAPPDLVSAPFGAGPQACAALPALPMQPNNGGRIKMMIQ